MVWTSLGKILVFILALACGWLLRTRQARKLTLRELSRFVSQSPDPSCALRDDGTLLACSAAFRRLCGEGARRIADLPFPADVLENLMLPHGAMSQSRTMDITDPQGDHHIIRLSLYCPVAPANRGWRVLLVQDLTEQERLHHENLRWNTALNGSRIGLYYFDLSTRRVTTTRQCLQAMLGLDDDWLDVDFERWLSLIHPDERSKLERLLNHPDPLTAGAASMEYRMRHKEGHWEWIEQRTQLINRDRNHREIVALCHVITPRKLAEQEIRRREQEFRMLVENSADIISRYDLELRCQYINRSVTRYAPLNRDDHIGRRIDEKGWPDDAAQKVIEACRQVIREREHRTIEIEIALNDHVYVFESRIFPEFDGHGQLASLLCIDREITEARMANRLLSDENAIMEMIADNRPIKETLEQICRLIETQLNQSMCSIMMIDESGSSLSVMAGPSLPEAYTARLINIPIAPETGSCGTAAFWKRTVVVSDIATSPLWANYTALVESFDLRSCWSTPILAADRTLLGTFAVYFREARNPAADELRLIYRTSHITAIALQRNLHESQLYQMATRDGMTGLLNRRHFVELADRELKQTSRDNRTAAVLMMDLDRFKSINDTYGHAAGDLVINHFSQLCRAILRSTDFIGRMGGEEFCALLPGSDLQEALQIAERIRRTTESDSVLTQEGTQIRYQVSIGVAVTEPAELMDSLLRRADRHLYAAKETGRNRVCSEDAAPALENR